MSPYDFDDEDTDEPIVGRCHHCSGDLFQGKPCNCQGAADDRDDEIPSFTHGDDEYPGSPWEEKELHQA